MDEVPLLKVSNIQISYGGIKALKDVSLEVFAGDLVTLIGANGAGKTSTLKAICRLLPLQAGDVVFKGDNINSVATHHLTAMGISLVPEGRGIFKRMTVIENLHIGAFLNNNKKEINDLVAHVYELFPRLKERNSQLAGTLSGGEQQMLAMGRALMSKPQLLLLDEPSMGLAPIMVDKIFEVVRNISSEGTTILLVEQNARLALEVSNRGYVMDSGVITASGNSKDLASDVKVRQAYLGE